MSTAIELSSDKEIIVPTKGAYSDVRIKVSGAVARALEKLSSDESKGWDQLIQRAINLSIGLAYGRYKIVDGDPTAQLAKSEGESPDRDIKINLNGVTSGELLRASTAAQVLPDALVMRGITALLQAASGRYKIVEISK